MASTQPARSDPSSQRDGKIIEAGTFASEIIDRLRSLYKKDLPKRELVAINEVVGEMATMLRGEASMEYRSAPI